MSATYIRADKVVNTLLGGGLVSLVVIYFYNHPDQLLNNKRWVAIALLSTLTLFLFWLIGAIKRFHERAIERMKERHEADLLNANIRMMNIEQLSRFSGRAEEIHKLFDVPISAERTLKWWCDDLENIIDERFNHSVRMDIIGSDERYRALPDNEHQVAHLLSYRHKKIRKLIAQQYLQPDEIAEKVAGSSTLPMPKTSASNSTHTYSE